MVMYALTEEGAALVDAVLASRQVVAQ